MVSLTAGSTLLYAGCGSDNGGNRADANSQPSIDSSMIDAEPSIDAGPHAIDDMGPGLTTLVGFTDRGYVDGPRTFALFDNPVNVHVGPNGNIYVADFDNGYVRKITPEGDTTSFIKQNNFDRPFGMVFSSTGIFFVQTDRNSKGDDTGALWKVNLTTGAATLQVDDIGRVRGLGALSDGRLVMADAEAHTVRIYNPQDKSIVDLAGQNDMAAYANGTGAAARFNRPLDVVVTAEDEIYVADLGNHRIRHITLEGVVTTVVGDGINRSVDGLGVMVDGMGGVASTSSPAGLTLDGDILYFSEFNTGLIRRLANGFVTTVAGSAPGFADNVDPLKGKLFQNEGIDIDNTGEYIYISDGNGGGEEPYHRVRRLEVSTL